MNDETTLEAKPEGKAQKNVEKRLTRLEALVRKLIGKAEIHWGKDIDMDGKIGSANIFVVMAIAALMVVGSLAIADETVWDLSNSSSTTCKVTKASSGAATLTVDKMSVGVLTPSGVLVDGNAVITGTLTTTGNVTTVGTSGLTGLLTVNNELVKTNLTVAGNSSVTGTSTHVGLVTVNNETINTNLLVGGAVTVVGNHTVTGNVTVVGALNAAAITGTSVRVSGNGFVGGNTINVGTFTSTGLVTAVANALVGGDAYVAGSATVTGNLAVATFNAGAITGTSVRVSGNSFVGGNTINVGTLTSTGAVTTAAGVDAATASTFRDNVTVVGTLTSTGLVTAVANALVGGDAYVAGTLTSTGAVTLVSTLGVSGLTTLSAGIVLPYAAVTTNRPFTTAQYTQVVTPGDIFTNTLPDANTMLGQEFHIVCAGTTDFMLNTDGTDTFDGTNKQIPFTDVGDAVTIQAVSANLWTLIQNTGTTPGAIP